MKKIIFIIFIFGLLSSCNERIVQLPETTNKDITEVTDVSPIYMFYDEEKDSIEFNRRNMITATNWLVNIDKRLTLKQILPHLQYLQEKRQGDEKHSFHNYFTCNNTELKNLSFIEFTDSKFLSNQQEHIISDETASLEIHHLMINQGEILIISSKNEVIESTKESLIQNILNTESLSNGIMYLAFEQSLSFQDYISIKTLLLDLKDQNLKLAEEEFIHN